MKQLRFCVLSVVIALTCTWALRAFAASPAAAADVAIAIEGFQFSPSARTLTVGDTAVWTNLDGAPHTATSDTGLFDSGTLSRNGAFRFTFTEPGTYPYHCAIHPSMRGTIVVMAASGPPSQSAPTLSSPADNERVTSFGPRLDWSNPAGATQYQLQIVPAGNDGPGVDLHVDSAGTSFEVLPPPQWYGLLPDITYTWRVRTSGAAGFVGLDDASWGPWAERKFRTPRITSATISAVSPAAGATVSGLTPTLQWANSRNDLFYYEVQLSRDPNFGPNSFLYSELRHGGVTTPPNSYAVPPQFPLQAGTPYFWRVRPRVQGDGTPVSWSSSFTFNTAAPGAGPTATPTPTASPIATPTHAPTMNGRERDGY